MGQIRVNQLRSASGTQTKTPQDLYYGRGRKWVEFNGSGTVNERVSYGVSNVGDLGVGVYRVNFSGNMPSARYIALGSCVGSTTGTDRSVLVPRLGNAKQTSYCDLEVRQPSNATINDADYIGIAFVGGN